MSEIGATSRSQTIQALQQANRARRARSVLKRQVADGQLGPAEVILTCPSEVASMPVGQLLRCQPGWGAVRSRALLARVAVREDKSIGSLTDRQRHALASQLTQTTARAQLDLPPTSLDNDMTGPTLHFGILEGDSGGCLRLSLTGQLDLSSAATLEHRLAPLRARKSPVRLDLSRLKFIDSTGIHLLIRTIGEARMKGWPVQIEPDVAPQVMRVFRLVHLDRFAGGSSS